MNVTSKDGLLVGELGWTNYPLAYPKSINLMRKVQHAYDTVLQEVDFLIMPTCITPSNRYPTPGATPLEQSNAAVGKLENTSSFNGTGHPALAMPMGLVDVEDSEVAGLKMPVSLQIVGRYWDEVGILKAAYAWEKTQDWRSL